MRFLIPCLLSVCCTLTLLCAESPGKNTQKYYIQVGGTSFEIKQPQLEQLNGISSFFALMNDDVKDNSNIIELPGVSVYSWSEIQRMLPLLADVANEKKTIKLVTQTMNKKGIDSQRLYELLDASNFLDIKPLFKACWQLFLPLLTDIAFFKEFLASQTFAASIRNEFFALARDQLIQEIMPYYLPENIAGFKEEKLIKAKPEGDAGFNHAGTCLFYTCIDGRPAIQNLLSKKTFLPEVENTAKVVFSQDDTIVSFLSTDRTSITMYDCIAMQGKDRINNNEPIADFILTTDNQLHMILANRKTIKNGFLDGQAQVQEQDMPEEIVVLSPSGRYVVMRGNDALILFDLHTNKKILTAPDAHTAPSAWFNEDETLLFINRFTKPRLFKNRLHDMIDIRNLRTNAEQNIFLKGSLSIVDCAKNSRFGAAIAFQADYTQTQCTLLGMYLFCPHTGEKLCVLGCPKKDLLLNQVLQNRYHCLRIVDNRAIYFVSGDTLYRWQLPIEEFKQLTYKQLMYLKYMLQDKKQRSADPKIMRELSIIKTSLPDYFQKMHKGK